MEFLRFVKRRSLLSETVYILLNVALAAVIFTLVLTVQNVWLALGVALLSKWRVFAVRPRYWWVNIISNMVDIIVTISYVVMLYAAQNVVALQITLLLLFIFWLLIIKPRSSRRMVSLQALVAIFTGTTSLALVAYAADSVIFVVVMWLIGYIAARHFFTAYDSDQSTLLSLIWGFILAEIGWLGYYWLFVYSVFGTANFKLVQLALIVTLLSFFAGRAMELRQERAIRFGELALPAAFSFGLIIVLIFVFNNINAVGSI